MKNSNINSKNFSTWLNPLVIVVVTLIALIFILSIFRSASSFLKLGLGINARIGDLKGSIALETFDNQDKPSFVMYYAEWCGHCKRTMPEFEKLKDNYKGSIKIIAINSEDAQYAELIKTQEIKGFPTIRYYPSGLSGSYQEYNGGRTQSDFEGFLQSVVGVNDPLPDQASPY
jgi:thiol-disulfide isomerase/thioredoxin